MLERVQAIAKHVPMSPFKARRLLEPLRGMRAQAALDVLKVMPHSAAKSLYKLIHSAVANADEKGLDVANLYIAILTADEGPGRMPGKGWRAGWGSRGRYRPIRKRSSHLKVILEERPED